MNNDNFLIESSDIELARDLCKYINDPELRNRGVANTLASGIAAKYFQEAEVDTESGLHNIAAVLQDIEISDIYINGAFIDVRLYFNENELCVPKAHFDNNLLPVAYMFIKIDEEISSGLVTGFVTPNLVDTSTCVKGYYKVNEEDLQSFYDIEPLLYSEPYDEIPENFETQIFNYLDNRLEDKPTFYKVLINSVDYRKAFINAAKAHNIFNFVSIADQNKAPSETNEILELNDTIEENLELTEVEPLEDSDGSFELLEETDDSIEEFNSEDIVESNLAEYEPLEASEELEELSPIDAIEEYECEDLEIINTDENLVEEIVETSFEDTATLEVDNIDSTEDFTLQTEEAEEIEILESDIEENEVIDARISEDTENESFDTTEAIESNESLKQSTEFSTSTTPSLDTIEEDEDVNNDDAIFEELAIVSEINEEIEDVVETEETVANNDANIDSEGNSNNREEEIDGLFGDIAAEDAEEEFIQPQAKKKSLLPMIGLLTILGAAGYFGYSKFTSMNSNTNNDYVEPAQAVVKPTKALPAVKKEAMPIETVENIKTELNSDEGNSVSIPAIEKNLDASILVTNLSVNWEVPASYLNNPSTKRYFVKMGKIIQLNLKTELLLLSKPPITNRIAVELEFNKSNNRFSVKQISASSGEKSIDDIIIKTINKALDLNLSTNMNSFSSIQGNPVLIIHL